MDVKFLIEEGFFDLLGVVAELKSAASCCADADVIARYDLWLVHGLAVEFVLLTPKDGRCNPSRAHLTRVRHRMPDRSNRTNRAAENRYLAVSRDIWQQMRRCWFLRMRLQRGEDLSIVRRKHTSGSPLVY